MTAGAVSPAAAAFLDSFGWDGWTPTERATLLFVVRDGQILLIEKHRGLGSGKVNGPGGRLEAGETPEAAAVREVEEEVGVRPTGIRPAGELRFQFITGYSIQVYVFRADGHAGDPVPTPEATPFWTDLASIPYGRMWEDDAVWLPLLLRHQPFVGRFVFDGDLMLTSEVRLLDRVPGCDGTARPPESSPNGPVP